MKANISGSRSSKKGAQENVEAQPLIIDEMTTEIDMNHNAAEKKDSMVTRTHKRNNHKVSINTVAIPPLDIPLQKENNIRENDSQKRLSIKAEDLGSTEYKKAYNVKYAYSSGSMYKGIASSKMVIALNKAGMMSYFGTGGLSLEKIEEEIRTIQKEVKNSNAYGMNILYGLGNPEHEKNTADVYLKYGVKNIEASAYMQVTEPLVKFRLKGLKKGSNGEVISENRIQAKISRPEVAEAFLSPAPEKIVERLVMNQEVTVEEAEMAKRVPLATDICVEADSGGHTDQGVMVVLIPTIKRLINEMVKKYEYKEKINLGAAGGIGTPESAAAAFFLGCDYIVTGSINQCTVEAGISDVVKDMLESINIQDTDYAPAGDMFELGAKIQVLKKGVFFPARANKLYELYKQYNSIDELDEKIKVQLEQKYFKRSFAEIYDDCKAYYPVKEIEKANENAKQKMAMIFKWYFGYGTHIAMAGDEANKVNFQVQCGKALGSFNQWVKGTELEKWQNRNVDKIAMKLLNETAEYFSNMISRFV
jgi:trans-AT polyketide synthase, acyltransferase and oxidoreductase domains